MLSSRAAARPTGRLLPYGDRTAVDSERDAYLRALRDDHLGEVVGEVDHRVQALVALRPSVRAKAREFAAAEVETRRRLEAELARHGVVVGRRRAVRALAWVVLLPLKLVLPTRAWVALLARVTARAVRSFKRHQARFGARNPELFAWLVEHEVRQRDWARAFLGHDAQPPPR